VQYRSLPKSEIKLSVLGYGGMRFPTTGAGKIDRVKATEQVKLAIDGGVNYIDTAYPYHLGESESFLGDCILSTEYRKKVYIASKLPCFLIRKSGMFESIFKKQIKKLKVDCIDFYMLHALTGSLFDKMVSFGVLDFLDALKAQGKIRFAGFSFHGNHADFLRIVDSYDWDFTQVQYNFLDVHFQAGEKGIAYAANKGLGIFIMEPLRGGTLVRKVPASVKKIWDEADVKRSAADWALRWILNNPNVHVVLSGMNEQSHIIENIKSVSDAYENSLTERELSIIKEVKDEYSRLVKIKCTGCGYCMPCPVGIDIPGAFHAVNNLMFTKSVMEIFGYISVAGFKQEQTWTTGCTDCGKCEKACPQDIAIRREFKTVRRYVERPIFRLITSYILRPFWISSKRDKKQDEEYEKA
jgi:uncharacterized protein